MYRQLVNSRAYMLTLFAWFVFHCALYVWFATDVDCVVYAGFTHSCDVRRFSEKGDTKLTLLVLNRFSEIVHSHQPIPA